MSWLSGFLAQFTSFIYFQFIHRNIYQAPSAGFGFLTNSWKSKASGARSVVRLRLKFLREKKVLKFEVFPTAPTAAAAAKKSEEKMKVIPKSEGLILLKRFSTNGILRADAHFFLNLMKPIMKYKKPIFHLSYTRFYIYFISQQNFSFDFYRFSPLQSKMFDMFCSSHVIDLWACFENDFDKCEP